VALNGGKLQLPQEYWTRLTEGMGGVVVSSNLGPNTVVLLGHSSQSDMLSALPQTLQAQGVRIMRGWMESADSGLTVDAFEVCDLINGERLSERNAARLEGALAQVVRSVAVQEVLSEIEGQVPDLDALHGLQIGGSRPPPMREAYRALSGTAFKVVEACDLGGALVFRGALEQGASAEETLRECKDRLNAVATGSNAQWECLLTTAKVSAKAGLMLVLVPSADLSQALAPPYDQTIAFMVGFFLTAIYAQAAAPSSLGVAPPLGALIFGVVAATEAARQVVARSYGVRLGPPVLLPSPALGSFGTATRALGVLPSEAVAFDMAAAASMTAFAVSFVLIAVGIGSPVTQSSCAWVNLAQLPYLLQLAADSAQAAPGVCLDAPAVAGYLPVSTTFAAGAFGTTIAALNSLPLGKLDGAAIAAAHRGTKLQDTVLPWIAFIYLSLSVFDAPSSAIFPVLLEFLLFTYFLRPFLVTDPLFRDNATKPWNTSRRALAFVLFFFAFGTLAPSIMVT